ncbi:8775_t:CDS:2 [Dentiscutata erythropus]|uniref:8775_t:CDS:1 n=1 Tax=Dentiscutata erythropus TaxID=1348616 RepID=A0A9N9ND48_9GLOM|nr:8775_t:CDS:2 [Dentiscutata erythropus]
MPIMIECACEVWKKNVEELKNIIQKSEAPTVLHLYAIIPGDIKQARKKYETGNVI